MVTMLRNARMLVEGVPSVAESRFECEPMSSRGSCCPVSFKESDEWEGVYASGAGSEFDARRFESFRLKKECILCRW